jgi:hypothetical protein
MEKHADIAILRDRLLDGLIPFNDFAAAMGKHPTTARKLRPPVVRVGRSVYVPEKEGREWLLNGCRRTEHPHCGRAA